VPTCRWHPAEAASEACADSRRGNARGRVPAPSVVRRGRRAVALACDNDGFTFAESGFDGALQTGGSTFRPRRRGRGFFSRPSCGARRQKRARAGRKISPLSQQAFERVKTRAALFEFALLFGGSAERRSISSCVFALECAEAFLFGFKQAGAVLDCSMGCAILRIRLAQRELVVGGVCARRFCGTRFIREVSSDSPE